MFDTVNLEAREHLLRIQASLAADAVLQQRALTEKLANTSPSDLGQRALDATFASQGAQYPDGGGVLECIAWGGNPAGRGLGRSSQQGLGGRVTEILGLGVCSLGVCG